MLLLSRMCNNNFGSVQADMMSHLDSDLEKVKTEKVHIA